MASRRPFRVLAGVVAGLLVVGGGGAAAYADQIVSDGDGTAPLTGGTAASVEACVGQAVDFDVLVAARRNGGANDNANNNVFANNSTVKVSISAATAGITGTLADSTIVLPGDWQDKATNSLSLETVTAALTLPGKATGGSGTVTFGYSGVNNAGAAVTGTNVVNVNWTTKGCDTVAPVLHLPAGITAEATGPGGAAVTFAPTATDETAPLAPAVTCSPLSGSTFVIGSTTVECSATDAAGNTREGSFTVTVQDKTAPTVGATPVVEFEASGPLTQATWTNPTATDAVDGTLPTVCTPASGSTFPVGATTVACSVTDAHGNTGTASFTVTISDTTAPILTLPSGLTIEATGPDGAIATYAPTAFDLVDESVPVVCTPVSGSTLPLGTTTVECSAEDAVGNGAAGSFDVLVEDTTAPTVTVPANISKEATGPSGAAATFQVSASDIVDGTVDVSCDRAPGDTFALGTTTVSCSATDDAGNESTATFTVTVRDTTAPVISEQDDILAEATGPEGAAVNYEVTALDLVDGEVEVACEPASGSTFALTSTQVDCTATDEAGNTASTSFAVTVEDTTEPVITWVGGPAAGSYVFGSVPAAGTCTAYDLVDGAVDCAVTGYGTTVGSHTLVAAATDEAGNGASESRTYSVSAWTLGGFYQPVDMAGVVNSVKGGSTVPLKFEIVAGSTELTATSAISSFTQKQVTCPGSLATDEVEVTTTGGTTLRYDATAGQFIQNWQTPKKPGACYTVTMTSQDGSSVSALFKLK